MENNSYTDILMQNIFNILTTVGVYYVEKDDSLSGVTFEESPPVRDEIVLSHPKVIAYIVKNTIQGNGLAEKIYLGFVSTKLSNNEVDNNEYYFAGHYYSMEIGRDLFFWIKRIHADSVRVTVPTPLFKHSRYDYGLFPVKEHRRLSNRKVKFDLDNRFK